MPGGVGAVEEHGGDGVHSSRCYRTRNGGLEADAAEHHGAGDDDETWRGWGEGAVIPYLIDEER